MPKGVAAACAEEERKRAAAVTRRRKAEEEAREESRKLKELKLAREEKEHALRTASDRRSTRHGSDAAEVSASVVLGLKLDVSEREKKRVMSRHAADIRAMERATEAEAALKEAEAGGRDRAADTRAGGPAGRA
eukprot:6927515-Prymnesium_polylepis.1